VNFEGRGKALYAKCSGPRGNLIEDMEFLYPVPTCSRWQANQLRAHIGSNWLPHSLRRAAPKRSRRLQPPSRRSGARFVKIAVHVVELMVVIKLPSGRHACGDDGRDHDAGPMIDAARAASPHFNHKTRSDCRGGALFRPLSTTYADG
jgi:hypothetical protein